MAVKIELYRDHFQNFKRYGIPKAQLVIADIPYNLAENAFASNPQWYKDGDNKNGESELAGKSFFNTDSDFRIAEYMHFCNDLLIKVKPTQEYFDELKRVSKNWIVWGGNFFGLSGGVIAWNKHGTAFGEGEVAICSTHKSVRFFDFTWNGMIQGNMKNKEERIHSCQKPIALYTWLLQNYATRGDKIIDTHVGSASSLIACHRMGFEYWGYELDESYFKAASERLAREKATTPLFEPQEIYKQEGLTFD